MNEKPIVLITLEYPPQKGGVASYLGNLVSASNGHIETLTSSETKFFRSIWPRWWPLVNICRSRYKQNQIIFISHVFPVGTAAWIASFIHQPAKYVIIFHGLDLRLARGFWKKFLLRRICARATTLITNSESTKRELLQLVPSVQASVITPAVSDEIFPDRETARTQLGLSSEEKVVLSISRLVPRKGIDKAIESMAKLQAAQKIKYIVMGTGDDRSRLEKLALEKHVEVTWLSDVSDVEKQNWLAAADLFLLPTREEKLDVEGFGIVFLEAAKAGIPSIAGNSGGTSEAVLNGKTGILVDPLNIDEIAQNVAKCLADHDLGRMYGQAALKRVRTDFKWSNRWSELARLLQISA